MYGTSCDNCNFEDYKLQAQSRPFCTLEAPGEKFIKVNTPGEEFWVEVEI